MRIAARTRLGALAIVCGLVAWNAGTVGAEAAAAEASAATAPPPQAAATAPRVAIPEAMSSLIPADAVALLYFESSLAVAADLAAFDPDGAAGRDTSGQVLLGMLTRSTGISAERIDPARPLAVAMALTPANQMGAPPMPTFLLPYRDLEGLKGDLAGRPGMASAPVLRDDYVGISLDPGYEGGAPGSPLAADLPAHTAVLRLRAAEIITALRPMIDAALAQMGARTQAALPDSTFPDPRLARQMAAAQQMQSKMLAHWIEAMAATPLLEVSADVSGTQLEAGYDVRLGEGAARKYCLPASTVGMADLARILPSDLPLLMVMGSDFDALADLYEPWFGTMAAQEPSPEVPFAMSPERVAATLELMRALGDHLAVGYRIGQAGLEGVCVLTAEDPQLLLDLLRRAVDGLPMDGVEESLLAGPTVEGIQTTIYTQQIDFERLEALTAVPDSARMQMLATNPNALLRRVFGSEGLVFRMAPLPGRLVVACGPDADALGRAIRQARSGKGQLPPGLSAMDAGSRDRLVLWGEAELRALLLPIFEAAAQSDASSAAMLQMLRDGPACPASARAFLENDRLHGGYRVDLAAIKLLMGAAARRPNRPTAPRRPRGGTDRTPGRRRRRAAETPGQMPRPSRGRGGS